MADTEEPLEQTVRDVIDRVVQRAPRGGALVWLWRKPGHTEAAFMRYGEEPMLSTFREVLEYVVRAVWHRAYRQGLEDAGAGTELTERPFTLLPPRPYLEPAGEEEPPTRKTHPVR